MTQAALLGITICLTSALVVLGALAIFTGLSRPKRAADIRFDATDHDVVFIFRESELVDGSDAARALLATLPVPEHTLAKPSDLAVLMQYLCARFAGVQEKLGTLAHSGGWDLPSHTGDGLILRARFHKGLTQLRLTDTSDDGALLVIDRLSHDAQQKELKTLRAVVCNLPTLVWKTDEYGNIIWANAAYIGALRGVEGADLALVWPLPDLFSNTTAQTEDRLAFEKQGRTHWFAHSQIEDGGHVTHFATPIDAAVQSEAARRETVQTLTRTFACLPIGLALFDADRRLQVFNPALVDLTGLEPLFLAARPSFEQVLYAMRENRMLPEPKNFNSWRADILDMEKASENGSYAEEWCLEGGRTYLVTGRPQPNGAIALFLQDITSEATLARSFRAEIETAHKVLDRLDEGIAVFSLSGQAVLANATYVRLWQTDPCADLADAGLSQALAQWAARCEPTQFWARLAEFISTQTGQDQITGTIALRTGLPLNVTASRVSGGSLMLRFQDASAAAAHAHSDRLRRPDLAGPPADDMDQDALPPPPLAPRKPRSARHTGTRLRA
ncbi:PAS domain-containing protein [Roseinatronobacter thiooxidans]|uniref:PAS domain-containing protein n=1 Tax=Roseinatronobacter thiooxidans TaxID=121821 RepID=A0A2W7QWY9_9RHOB|nr:PAS-domain containing protein [Roseinatronobacter thiooxidans]PZX46199.1 PAS domain-containing protein [Roseinatronobacter thiooxidans]